MRPALRPRVVRSSFFEVRLMATVNSFGTRMSLAVGGRRAQMYSLPTLQAGGCPGVERLPYSMKVLLENLLRHEDGRFVKAADIEAMATWDVKGTAQKEISFAPARVLLQDFTGVPAVVDLAAMRDGIARLGGDPNRVNPLQPVELVIDHSVQVDYFGQANAFQLNAELEFSRNKERYAFLRWGQNAFDNFRVVPPDTGIVHQVNLEYLARVVMTADSADGAVLFPRHAGRHRLAYDDGEWAGRGGVGRGRHRGRSGDARSADFHAHPQGPRIPADRHDARRRHRHGSRADHHRTAAQARCRRQVRGVLRPGPRRFDDCRSCHARQHVPGVRRDHRDFSDRRHDARLPAPHRSRAGARRAGRSVCEGAGDVPHAGGPGSDLFRNHRARSRNGRTEPRRTSPAAGSRVVEARESGFPGGAHLDDGRLAEERRGSRRSAHVSATTGGAAAAVAEVPRSPPRSTTAPLSSRRSRAARTPRTPA